MKNINSTNNEKACESFCRNPENCKGCFKPNLLSSLFKKIWKYKTPFLVGIVGMYALNASFEVNQLKKDNEELRNDFSEAVSLVNSLVKKQQEEDTNKATKEEKSLNEIKQTPAPVESQENTVPSTKEEKKDLLEKAINKENQSEKVNAEKANDDLLEKRILTKELEFKKDIGSFINGKDDNFKQVKFVEVLKKYQFDNLGNKRLYVDRFSDLFPQEREKDFSLEKFRNYLKERSERYSEEKIQSIYQQGLFKYCQESKECTFGQGIIVNNIFGRPSMDFVGFEMIMKEDDKELKESHLLKLYKRVESGVGVSLKQIETNFLDTTFAFIDLDKIKQSDLVSFIENVKKIIDNDPKANFVIFPIDTGNDEKYNLFMRGATKYHINEFISKLKAPVEDYLVFGDVYINEELGKRILEGNLGNQFVKLEQIGYIDDVVLIKPMIEEDSNNVKFAMAFSLLNEKDLELWFKGEMDESKEENKQEKKE